MDQSREEQDSALRGLHELDSPRQNPSAPATTQAQPNQQFFEQGENELLDEDIDAGVEGLDELTAPAPDQNPDGGRIQYHRSLEEEIELGRRRSGASEQLRPRTPTQPKWMAQLYIHCWLIFFSIFGTLARLGVEWLAHYRNAPVTTDVLWANFGGSLVLGFLQEDRALFAQQRERRSSLALSRSASESDLKVEKERREAQAKFLAAKKSIPLYIGLSVGFCGSFTSFSSFMRDLWLGVSNELAGKGETIASRDDGWSVAAVLGIMIIEVAVSLFALLVGAHLSIAVFPLLSKLPKINSARFMNPLSILLGLGCWLGAVFLAIWPPQRRWRGDAIFAIVFAPPGAILRYWLSIKLNPKVPSFPLGTFSANMLGTAVIAMAYDLQHARLGNKGIMGGSVVGCQVLMGVMDGFCGCLTTVSTWVAELRSLRKHCAYAYGFASVVIGFCLMIVIVGSLRWTGRLGMPVCGS